MSDFLTAEDMAIVVEFGSVDQAVVKGLDSIGLPALSREIATVKEFREAISRQFTTGGSLGNVNFSGTYVKNDTAGYNKLVEYYIANSKKTDMRVYLNRNDFLCCDIYNDATSAMQVSELAKPDADSNGVIPMSGILVLNGRPITCFVHSSLYDAVDGDDLTFVQGSGGPDTITSSAIDFVAKGFVAGQSLIIDGSTANDAVKTGIAIVDTNLLTLVSEGDIVDGAGLIGTKLHGGLLN